MSFRLAGEYFDGRSARPYQAVLHIADEGSLRLELHLAGTDTHSTYGGSTADDPAPVVPATAPLSTNTICDLNLPSRLGNSPISMRFPDGAAFVSQDNDAVDALRAAFFASHQQTWLVRFERSWPLALTLVVLLAGASWWGFERGLPALASRLAQALPADTLATLGAESLAVLDRTAFDASELLPHEQERLERVFAEVAAAAEQRGDLAQPTQLVSRHGGRLGANAFALPDGNIVVTDELLALAETDAELAGVLAHELGHLAQRHSIRQALQSAGIAAALISLTGDLGSASTLLAGLPTALANARYSRDFEREADQYSASLLSSLGMPLDGFGHLLARLETSHGGDEDPLPLLASHPGSAERSQSYTAGPD